MYKVDKFGFGFTDKLFSSEDAMMGLMGFESTQILRIPQELAEETRDEIVNAIENQEMAHTPLSESWSAYKEKHGLDSRILIATGQMVGAIQVEHLGAGSYGVVVPDTELEQQFIWNEYGTPHIPARHTWSVIAERVWDKLPLKVQQYKLRASTIASSSWRNSSSMEDL